jgi:ankyrin repeat protein
MTSISKSVPVLRVLIFGFFFLNLLLCVAVLVSCRQEPAARRQQTPGREVAAPDPEVVKFFKAVDMDSLDGVRRQLDRGVDVNARNAGQETALHVTQDPDMMSLLLAYGADVNARNDMGMTPMFTKELPLARMLVEAGADIHATSDKGNSIVMWYTYSGYLKGVKYFLKQGVDVNHVNEDGQTAYDIARTFAHIELLEYLKSIGAKPGRAVGKDRP